MVKPRQDFLGAITRLAEDGSGIIDGYGAELHNVTIVLNERGSIPSTGDGRGSFWVLYDGYEGRPKFTDRDGYTIDLGVGRDGYVTSSILWSQVTRTPTTINGYGITDAVNITDFRLTNSRTPTAHASTHLFDGYDPIDGYNVGINYISINYISPTHNIIGEHLRRIDDKLGDLSSNIIVGSRTISTTTPLQGGGSLATDLTLSVSTVGGTSSGVVPAIGGNPFRVLASADGYVSSWISITDNYVTNVGWAKIINKPTTLSGYGITDAASKVYVDGYFNNRFINTTAPLIGGGRLATDLTLSVAAVSNTTSGVVPAISVSPTGLLVTNNGTSASWVSKISTAFITAGTTPNRVISTDGYNATWTQVSDAMITSVAWTKITGTPTTLVGYGITDAIALTSSPPADVTKSTSAIGLSTTAARSDHKHNISTDVASALTVGGLSAEGSSISLARADHLHALPAFGNTSGTFAQGNDVRFPPVVSSSNTVLISNGISMMWGKISDGYVSGVSWTKITSTPTTINGYGITDAASKIYVDGYFNNRFINTNAPLAGGGRLATDLTLSVAAVSNTSSGVVSNITGSNFVLLTTNGTSSSWGQVSNNYISDVAWTKITNPVILDGYVSSISWSKITNTPTTINGYGITDAASKTYVDGYFNNRFVNTTTPLVGGGRLATDLTLSVNSVSNVSSGVAPIISGSNRVLLTNGITSAWGQIADGYISSISWTKIASTPTTINGYGITDAASKIYVDGYFNNRFINTTAPLAGGGRLATDLTLSIASVSNTSSGIVPTITGSNLVLLTNGTVGSWGQISDNYISSISWTKITSTPTTINGYGITDAASKVYVDGYFNNRFINTTAPLIGGGRLATDLTISVNSVSNISSGVVPTITGSNLVLLTNGTVGSWGQVSNNYISDVTWSKITLTPTTINGYGITDAASKVYVDGYFNNRFINTTAPLAGGGRLSTNLTLSVATATNTTSGIVPQLPAIANRLLLTTDGNTQTWGTISSSNMVGSHVLSPNNITTGTLDTILYSDGVTNLWSTLTDGSHGARGGGTLHAIVSGTTAGFAPTISTSGLLGSINGTTAQWISKIGTAFILGGATANQVLYTDGSSTNWSYVTDAMISGVAWTKITGTPTTVSGYGITDAVPTTRTISTTAPLAGGGALSSNLTLSVAAVSNLTAGVVPQVAVPGTIISQNGTSAIWIRYLPVNYIDSGTVANRVISSDGGVSSWTQVSDAMISGVNWSKVASHPTTLAGYGITDSVITGSGTSGTIPRFNGTTGLTNSSITDNGTLVNVNAVLNAKNFSLLTTGATEQWVLVGRFTAAQTGNTVKITLYIHAGYNSTNAQDNIVEVTFKTSNGGNLDPYGFAGNSSCYIIGVSTWFTARGRVKWIGNAAGVAATYYDLFVYLPAYAEGSHYSVTINSASTWTDIELGGRTEPGASSAIVCIPDQILTLQNQLAINSNQLRFYTPTGDSGGSTGIVGNPNGYTRFDPNGNWFLIPVTAAQATTNAIRVLDIERTDTGQQTFSLGSNGSVYFSGVAQFDTSILQAESSIQPASSVGPTTQAFDGRIITINKNGYGSYTSVPKSYEQSITYATYWDKQIGAFTVSGPSAKTIYFTSMINGNTPPNNTRAIGGILYLSWLGNGDLTNGCAQMFLFTADLNSSGIITAVHISNASTNGSIYVTAGSGTLPYISSSFTSSQFAFTITPTSAPTGQPTRFVWVCEYGWAQG